MYKCADIIVGPKVLRKNNSPETDYLPEKTQSYLELPC